MFAEMFRGIYNRLSAILVNQVAIIKALNIILGIVQAIKNKGDIHMATMEEAVAALNDSNTAIGDGVTAIAKAQQDIITEMQTLLTEVAAEPGNADKVAAAAADLATKAQTLKDSAAAM